MKVKKFKAKVCLKTNQAEEIEGEFVDIPRAKYGSHWQVPGFALVEIRKSEKWTGIDLFHPDTKTGAHVDVYVLVDRWGKVIFRRYSGWKIFELSNQEVLNLVWPTGQYCLKRVVLALFEKFPKMFYHEPQFGS
ncbi:hypothetical protein KKH07_01490 [Patescibacteria group bacterium]|nr:hypothetical protein [Patescibacteria group bacterium]MBU1563912.1 hypothetical protein [Patescibacteria group bacterium]MBU2068002.1 hypothetical protein [Patescibacteria group bacterium]